MRIRPLRFACTLLLVCALVFCAANPPQASAQSTQTPEKEFDMHAPYVRYHFQDSDMDFTFGSVVLGSISNGGAETGEAFYVAANIKDGDAASWQEQWLRMAARVEARGRKSLDGGHLISAREQLMRASNYYRFGLLAMMPDDPRLKPTAITSREVMKQAGKLYDPPLEYIEIPFEGTMLPGYFRKAARDDSPRKTLLMLGGGETFAEDLIFYIMPQAIERGYNFMTLDLPGQGILPLEGKTFRPEMYLAVKTAVDYALARKDVDPDRLAVFGISGGGGFAPQAAQHDPRIKAVIMNACVVDAYPLFASMTPVVTATPEKVAAFNSFHGNTVKIVAWRWGVPMDNVPGLVEANKGFSFDPAKVTVPALSLVGEGEYGGDETKRQQKLCLDGLANPTKQLVVTPLNEGASNHCVMENRSIVGQVAFDWLDDVFKK
ncbi:alpha/beta hydrolase [Desulfovibrio sulfodismutans]|uniref:Alpha/beta hydrolase n=1 Tax=Desulfolutivibrio sulfodismutans TaxID=63561 RepID=A0A7K3NH24_9BACT|nr:acetylxylan esterase [Desulfolutivibrio sulfodismutans]NDY55504.1 alpha/beta hydrolase [Desulfolutivibrio sulfodismutans]QLA12892.1 alpha/beta fold hydrolase [Desulfolutivibrio sulfodismutans DSM 3696]